MRSRVVLLLNINWKAAGAQVNHVLDFHTYFHVHMERPDITCLSGIIFQWLCVCCVSFIQSSLRGRNVDRPVLTEEALILLT